MEIFWVQSDTICRKDVRIMNYLLVLPDSVENFSVSWVSVTNAFKGHHQPFISFSWREHRHIVHFQVKTESMHSGPKFFHHASGGKVPVTLIIEEEGLGAMSELDGEQLYRHLVLNSQ